MKSQIFPLLVITQLLFFHPCLSFPAKLMENPNLIGGDMVGINYNEIGDRNAVPNATQRWPHGIIYYEIDQSLTYQTKLIKESIYHIEENTCIRFLPRTNQTDYVLIFSGTGCFSTVGVGGGQQTLSLGSGCDWFRIVVHELMHAIGFFHEHNRSDRDTYITIHWENVADDAMMQFFLLRDDENRLLSEFDFDSIMLYGPTTFSKNGNVTMESKVVEKEVRNLPASVGLSKQDIASINMLYDCN